MIITGEASGELYGARLATALKTKYPDIHILGVGGEKMQTASVDIIASITGAFGLIEAVSSLLKLKTAYKTIVRYLKLCHIDALVLIDFPDFNLKVAQKAKQLGIKILYYVSPQVWAWRQGRIAKIARLTDKIAAILPFEPQLYSKYGAQCEFVGHPVMEEIDALPKDRTNLRNEFLLQNTDTAIALLPGSRHSEIDRLLPILTDTASKIKENIKNAKFIIPLSPNIEPKRYEKQLNRLRTIGVNIINGKANEILYACDIAVIASGTAAFQAALIGTPMIVIYKLSPITYKIAKRLVKIKYVTLVNIIFDEQIVKELIQDNATPDNIAKEIQKLLNDKQALEHILSYFHKLRKIYENKEPTLKVIEMIEQICKDER
ncbi:lipid-A-disaccharide synthase [Candidatus Magnetoovum chiemensis]|nr:lipid-A-disaccharide synthase [Candidatus Magnetoovum chiemensis]